MQNPARVCHHSTPEQRAKILHLFRDSQLTHKEFAAQAGIGVSTLHAWLRKAAPKKGGGGPAFVAVPNLFSSLPSAPAYRLQWPGGLSLEVSAGFASEELAALLELLPAL
jgi:hypothetical protein